MKKMLKYLNKKENGNAIILVALAMGGMIAMLGLVIDGGHLYMQKSHLQKTANAAALSGVQEIPNDQAKAKVEKVVDEVLIAHEEQSSLLDEPEIEPYRWVRIELEKDVPLFFSSIFGFDSVPVKVNAKAELNPLGEAIGAVPLGINEQELANINYGDPYPLKVGSGESTTGNFGILALEGPGAKDYVNTLMEGFDEKLKVGEIINTQTGNMAGPTKEGVDYRINNCPDPSGIEQRDCSRIMLILVYEPYDYTSNKMNSVKVTGFAYFYVSERMSDTDDTVQGTFIKRAGAGSTGPDNPPDRGAYAIKLTK